MDFEDENDLMDEPMETVEENLFSENEDEEAEDDGNVDGDREDEAVETPAEEETSSARRVKPKKIIKNPQPKLNFERLQGPRGLCALNDMFKDVKFKGNGHELEDLTNMMLKYELWCNRLFPRFHFNDCLKRLESLGKKKMVQVYLKKIRLDMVCDNDVVRQFDEEPEDNENETVMTTVDEPFDQLLSEQISQSQTTATHGSQVTDSGLSDEQRDRMIRNRLLAEQISQSQTTATHESQVTDSGLSDEQRDRMIRNRLLAEERRLARLKAQQEENLRDVQNRIEEINVDAESSVKDSQIAAAEDDLSC